MNGSDDHSRLRSLQREALNRLVHATSGDATVGELRQLEVWCTQSEAHAEAYRSALRIWRTLGIAGCDVATAADRAMAAERSSPALLGRRAVLAGGLATAAAVGALMYRPPLGLWPSFSDLRADYHTAPGERRSVAMAAQVSAELNTRTSLDRRVVPQGEAIELIAGEVAIASTCSADRPFTVLAASGRTRSAHARFNVRYDGDAVRVTCIDGTIEIEQAASRSALQAGQQVSYSDRGIGSVGIVDPAAATSWQRGLLIFRDETVSRVIDEVNRYWPGRIVVLDPVLGGRRITVRVELARIGEVISYVQSVLDAKVRRLPGGIILLS